MSDRCTATEGEKDVGYVIMRAPSSPRSDTEGGAWTLWQKAGCVAALPNYVPAAAADAAAVSFLVFFFCRRMPLNSW